MKQILPLGLVALLGVGCPTDDGSRLEGNGPYGGSPDSPEYWKSGSGNKSIAVQGEGQSALISASHAVNSEFRVNYKEIGMFKDGVVSIPPDEDLGEYSLNGIGDYIILDDEFLTHENAPFYFGEDRTCNNGQEWGEYVNGLLEEHRGFLVRHEFYESGDSLIVPMFVIDGPWGGEDNPELSHLYIQSGPCSNI